MKTFEDLIREVEDNPTDNIAITLSNSQCKEPGYYKATYCTRIRPVPHICVVGWHLKPVRIWSDFTFEGAFKNINPWEWIRILVEAGYNLSPPTTV